MNEENSNSAHGYEASSEPLTMRAVLGIADVRRLWINALRVSCVG